jgi:hypothetical protein
MDIFSCAWLLIPIALTLIAPTLIAPKTKRNVRVVCQLKLYHLSRLIILSILSWLKITSSKIFSMFFNLLYSFQYIKARVPIPKVDGCKTLVHSTFVSWFSEEDLIPKLTMHSLSKNDIISGDKSGMTLNQIQWHMFRSTTITITHMRRIYSRVS